MILSGQLAAGQPITEVALARMLEVSRTPLREALGKLSNEGLVEARPHHQTRVTPLSAGDLEELYAVRVTLESFGATLTVPHLTDGQLAEIDLCLHDMDRFADQSDLRGWLAPHARFHEILISQAGSRLLGIAATMADHSIRYITMYCAHPRVSDLAAAEHRDIAEACRARDAQLAAVRLARHLARTALTLLAEAAPEHDPRAVRAALTRCSDAAAIH